MLRFCNGASYGRIPAPHNTASARPVDAILAVMVDIKAAVTSAIDFAKSSLGPNRTADIRLEEVESSVVDGTPVWLITLSAAADDGPSISFALGGLATVLGADAAREYKVFTVSKNSGDVLSMKIRLVAIPSTQ